MIFVVISSLKRMIKASKIIISYSGKQPYQFGYVKDVVKQLHQINKLLNQKSIIC